MQRLSEEQTPAYGSGDHAVDKNPAIEDEEVTESLDDEVEFWTDFAKVPYHHRTLCELHGSWSTLQEFNCHGIDKQIFSGSLEAEEIYNRLRFFAEECDHMQV